MRCLSEGEPVLWAGEGRPASLRKEVRFKGKREGSSLSLSSWARGPASMRSHTKPESGEAQVKGAGGGPCNDHTGSPGQAAPWTTRPSGTCLRWTAGLPRTTQGGLFPWGQHPKGRGHIYPALQCIGIGRTTHDGGPLRASAPEFIPLPGLIPIRSAGSPQPPLRALLP